MTPFPIPLHDQLTSDSRIVLSLRDDSSTNKNIFDHIGARMRLSPAIEE